MRNPNCNLCGLCNGVNTVCLWGEGPTPCDVMVIGRDPGEEEDKEGRPFVGRSGKLLKELLQAAGLKREDVFISNLVKCRPPGNRPHTSEERAACRVYLDQEIAAVQPKVIIVLGGDALEAITGQTQVMKLAGQAINFKNDKIDCQVFVSVHPSYILRNDSYKERAIKHFEGFGRLLRGEGPIKSPVKYVYIQTIEQVRKLIVKMHQQKFIVFDTETTGFDFLHDKILCFSFSWKENTAVVLPLLGYKQAVIWSEQDYNEIITSLQNLFANPDIEWCAQNISFDAKFMKTYNMEIVGPIHDTMILQTLCDENAVDLKGLKEMAKLYTDMGDYSEPLEKFKTGLKIEKRKVVQAERKGIKNRIKDLKKMLKKVEPEAVQSAQAAGVWIDIAYDIDILEHKLEELKDAGKDISYAEIPTNILWPYAAMDADATMRIFNVLMSKLYEESAKHAFSHNEKKPVNMVRYYKKLVMKLRKVLDDMEYHGAKLDLVYLAELDEKYTKRLSELEAELLEMSGVKQTEAALLKKSQEKAGKRYDTLKSVIAYKGGTGKKPKFTKKEYCIKHGKTVPFNMNSPVHLRALLFDVLKLVHPFPNKKGKTGELSTDADVLEALEDKHPCVTKLQENRKLGKLHKTYVKGQMKLTDANARVHTDFNQHITVTGRLSSSHPNLQNIPRANKDIKRAFIVEHGYFILQMDYAQAEFRMWAELSNDRDMISDIASGMDIHRATASQFWGIPEKDVTSEQRSAAKFVVFGLMYGRGAESVAKQVKISTEEAQAIIDQFFAKYPVASRWLRSIKMFTEKRGFVSGYFGRVRRLPYARLRHMDRQKWGESMRQAVNAPIQGGAADLTGIAMIKIHSELKAHPEWEAHLILTVHDSIILEVHKKDLAAVMKMCHQKMTENVDDMNTSMAADIEVGINWGDLAEISSNNIDGEVVKYLKTLEGVEV